MPVPAPLSAAYRTRVMTPTAIAVPTLTTKQRPLLPLDMCRCHDVTCEQRTECVRWIDRHVAGYIPHAETFSVSGTCAYQIKP
jgi:hypothetical protein